ncbi:MAG: glycoside hydrolase family 5 protein [Chloroflexaceae bacterium]|nr:glycoside hydrolase family 5 protein [Chloroflexaceae bacterium]
MVMATAQPAISTVPVQAAPTVQQATAATPPIYGIETNTGRIASRGVQNQASALGASWLRLNTVSWRGVQAEPDGPYDWSALANFERELAAANETGMIPIVIVDDYPRWATRYETSCSAITSDRFNDFAQFMTALVERYHQAPYNVRYWEMGNEVDIDPSLVAQDNFFGCWGDIEDTYYGGEHYGEMLKVVTPAIKQTDPNALVMIGGLLLDRPNTTISGRGKPERFLEGILEAGAADSFDIVAFHTYPWFRERRVDSDLTDYRWSLLGGGVIGKATFLRDIMARYGVDKPLFLNETALLGFIHEESFYQSQADHIVRMAIRAASIDIQAFCWYTLHNNGWFSGGLLDGSNQPRPAFIAYQQLIERTSGLGTPVRTNDYGDTVEAYRFTNRTVCLMCSGLAMRRHTPLNCHEQPLLLPLNVMASRWSWGQPPER